MPGTFIRKMCYRSEILTMIESRNDIFAGTKNERPSSWAISPYGKGQDRRNRSGSVGLSDVGYELINLTTNDNLINNKI